MPDEAARAPFCSMSYRILLDVEGNDLYDDATRIHCLVTQDIDTGKVRRFRERSQGRESLQAGIKYIEGAELVVGHNVLDYDLPVLKKICGLNYNGEVLDTLVCSRLIWTNLFDLDARQRRIPSNLWGAHSLESWGYRLRVYKGQFGKTADWKEWSKEMEDYCVQDVVVTDELYRLILDEDYSSTAIQLEHDFKRIIIEQERHGFRFDVAGAEKLTAKLQASRAKLREELQDVFPPREVELKTPAYWHTKLPNGKTVKAATKGELRKLLRGGLAKLVELKPGPPRIKYIPFNPGSRTQIAQRLGELYGWKPKQFTDDGRPKIDEAVLESMPWKEAKLLNKYLFVSKTLGQLIDGRNSCLKLVKNGRIHGSVNTNGAVTGRCTHSHPNVAQTPAVLTTKDKRGKTKVVLGLDGGFGWEFRSLYLADEGQVLVGWDASGLELRCLAHYLAPFDGGAFEKVLLTGDPHTANQKAAGLYLRPSAKTFIYAFLYGAGDEKLGSIVRQDCLDAGKPLPKGTLRELGAGLRARFLRNFPALARLKNAIKRTVEEHGRLIGLDGRILHVRSEHSALNTLLQSAGALLMKKALVFQHQALVERGYTLHRDYAFVANVHDEVQTSCSKKIATVVGKSGPVAIQAAGKFFRFRCRLDGEWKQGQSWAETH